MLSARRLIYDHAALRRAPRPLIVLFVGLASSVVFAGLALRGLDRAQLARAWAEAHVFPWALFAAASYVTGHWVRGARCRVLLGPNVKISLLTATNIVVIGYAANNVFPARLGELARAGMMTERTGVPYAQSLAITLIERLLDAAAILVCLFAASALLPPTGVAQTIERATFLLLAPALIGLAVVAFAPRLVVAIASRATARMPRLHDRAVTLVSRVCQAAGVLRRPGGAFAVVGLSLLVWVFESGLFAFLLPSFGMPASFPVGMFTMSLTNLGILVPSTPGYVGPFHFFVVKALTSLGVEGARAFGFAVLVHLTFYLPITAWGGAVIAWYGAQLGATVTTARRAQAAAVVREEEGGPMTVVAVVPKESIPSATPPKLIAAIAAALIPEARSAAASPESVARTAQFVVREIAALPVPLRVAFAVGMTGFRALVRLRYLRGFCDLPLPRQRSVVRAWAYGRVMPARQLFRPIRSLALFEHFERGSHPTRPGAAGRSNA